MNHRHVGSAFKWRESTCIVQNTWTWHGTDDFLELRLSEELEEFAAVRPGHAADPGTIKLTGTGKELLENEDVRKAYLGE